MAERSSGRRAVVLSLSYSHDGSTTSGAPFEVQSSQINAVTVSRMFNVSCALAVDYMPFCYSQSQCLSWV